MSDQQRRSAPDVTRRQFVHRAAAATIAAKLRPQSTNAISIGPLAHFIRSMFSLPSYGAIWQR